MSHSVAPVGKASGESSRKPQASHLLRQVLPDLPPSVDMVVAAYNADMMGKASPEDQHLRAEPCGLPEGFEGHPRP